MENKSNLILLSTIIMLSGCTPEHTTKNGFLDFQPDPGFVWASESSFSYDVIWKPGVKHPNFPNISSANKQGEWFPNAGYDWSSADVNSLAVTWRSGKVYEQLPHICSSTKEGTWEAEDGYKFINPAISAGVTWTPGDRGVENSHAFAANDEGTWAIDPGYEDFEADSVVNVRKIFQPCKKRPVVRWTPSRWHNQFEHVYSDTQEGHWRAEAGYSFVSQDSLVVVASSETPNNGPSDSASQFWQGVVKVAAGAFFSSDQPDDGAFANTVGRPAARALRDSGLSDIGEAITK